MRTSLTPSPEMAFDLYVAYMETWGMDHKEAWDELLDYEQVSWERLAEAWREMTQRYLGHARMQRHRSVIARQDWTRRTGEVA